MKQTEIKDAVLTSTAELCHFSSV